MTDRQANVRVNVSGNAASELGKVQKSVGGLSERARDARGRLLPMGQALNSVADAAKKVTPEANKLVGANQRVSAAALKSADSTNKLAAAVNRSSAVWKGNTNALKDAVASNQRVKAAMEAGSSSLDRFTRATDRANSATRSLSRNTRTIDISKLDRAAAAMGRIGNFNVGTGGNLGRVMGGVGALAGSALDASRGAASTLGIASRDQLASNYVDTEVRLARLSAQAHWSDAETERYRAQINDAARAGMMTPADIASIVETGQNRFSNAAGFLQASPDIARFAQATGTDTADISGLVGEAFRQMHVNPNEIGTLLGSLQATAEMGSVEAKDIAGSMAPSIGAYRALTGENGMQGMQNLFGLAQTLGASGGDAGVLMQNLIAKLSSGDVQRNLERGGIRVHDAQTGQFVGFQNLAEQISSSSHFMKADGTLNQAAMQRVLGADMQANSAMLTLVNETIAGRTDSGHGVANIAAASSEAGTNTIDTAMRRIQSGAAGTVVKARSDAAVNFAENGEGLVQTMADAARTVSEFDTRLPLASAAADQFRGALSSVTGTLGAMNLAGLASAGASGTAAAGGLASMTAKMGAFAGKLGAAGAALLVFEGTRRATTAILDAVDSERGQRSGVTAASAWNDFHGISIQNLSDFGNAVRGLWGNSDQDHLVRSEAEIKAGVERRGRVRDAQARTEAGVATTEDQRILAEEMRRLGTELRANTTATRENSASGGGGAPTGATTPGAP